MTDELREVLTSAAPDVAALTEAPIVPPSDTVTQADRWTKRVGERLAENWQQLGATDEPNSVAAEWTRDAQLSYIAADAMETLLSPSPKLHDRPADQHRARWWKQLIESSPEIAALRAQTMCAPAIAELAAAEVVQQWHTYSSAHPEPEPQTDENGEPVPFDGEQESAEDTIARIRSTRAAIKAATDAAEDAHGLAAGLGVGTQSSVDAQRLASLARKLKTSPRLAAIMKMAGRFIARAATLQRQRTNLPGLEVTGIELSGDVARLLPLESALVAGAVPEIEMLSLYKLATRHTLSYRHERREPLAQGPIVVSVDESGSMNGAPIEAAKGLALAMASLARAQKRPVMFASFADMPDVVPVDGSDTDAVIKWCETMLGGGTTLNGPLASVPFKHWPKGKVGAQADHIIISDAAVSAESRLTDEYNAWADEHNVRTFALVIGQTNAGDIEKVARGGVWCLPSLDLNSIAIETVLSIGPTTKQPKSKHSKLTQSTK